MLPTALMLLLPAAFTVYAVAMIARHRHDRR